MSSHRLDPLFRPRSLAIVGISARPGSVGEVMPRLAIAGGLPEALYPVNPLHERLQGRTLSEAERASA